MAKMKPHHFMPLPTGKKSSSSLSWPYCSHCGLILLKNEATARAAKQYCPGSDEDD